MNRKKRLVMLCLGIIFTLTLLVAGCGSPKETSNNSGETETKTETKTINIGWSGPLSGGAALYGQDTVLGVKMAIDEINGQGGITVNDQKYSFNLITLDDQYMPNLAANNARRLKLENQAPVIFVPHSGGIFALQEFNQTDNFLLAAFSSDPKITERGNNLTLRIPPPYDMFSEPFSKMAMDKFGKKLALLPSTTAYSKDWAVRIDAAWKKLGGNVVTNIPFDYNKETDFTTYVSKALAAKPDVIFVGGTAQPSAMVIKQARQLGFKGGFITTETGNLTRMETLISAQDLTGVVSILPFAKYDDPGISTYVDKFKSKNSKVPVWENVWNYESMWLIAKGMEKAQNVDDPSKIFEGMKQSLPLNGDNFPVELKGIDSKGGLMADSSAVMYDNGKYNNSVKIPYNTK
ncbi:MAG: ABC transporter substrate-binding protein [Clostridia bacterium]|nr:ABC transporter substrate-binding protein [Clostridia bacterium]